MELHCTLCPKNPKFSDVSHLLTHISSKGHLANRFKLQIRSQGEVEARQRLVDFDYWYHTNNLDSLLSDRLAAKEQKKGRKGRVVNCTASKTKKPSQSGQPSPIPDNHTNFRAPIPRMHLWPTTPDEIERFNNDCWEPELGYGISKERCTVTNFPSPEPLEKPDSQFNAQKKSAQDFIENNDDSDKLTDNTKLKGVLWPGMNLFDSATIEQKRMRNQRKGNEVLADMIYTSEQVEPSEVSYHASGEFRASRDIFGPLSGDDSPIRDPTPKKRKSIRRAPALGDLNTNATRLPSSRTKKSKQSYSPKKQYILAPPPDFTHTSLNSHTVSLPCSRHLQNLNDVDDEFHMTFNENLNEKKRDFDIFQDGSEISPGRTESPLQHHQFESSAHEEIFTDGSDHRFHQNGLGSFPSQVGLLSGITQTSPSRISKKYQTFGGKENLQPDLPTDSRDRRPLNSSQIYPAQIFYETPLNPLYHHGYARSCSNSSKKDISEIKSPNFPIFHGDHRPINPLAGAQHGSGYIRGNTLQFDF